MASEVDMQADYLDAHERHWHDAELLMGQQRWANADHLYGMAAECGLKRLMLAFGMPYDPTKNLPQKREDREHADGIWARYESYRCGHHRGAAYGLPSPNPFDNWKVAQRYAHQTCFTQARVQQHQAAAAQVRKLIALAKQEGLINDDFRPDRGADPRLVAAAARIRDESGMAAHQPRP
jgi:hypothetical protein